MKGLSMYPQFRAMIVVHLPKIFQGVIAAFGDFYTWKLADKVYGRGSNYAWTAVCVSLLIRGVHDPNFYSSPCPSSVLGNGSARQGRCRIPLRRFLPSQLCTIGLGHFIRTPTHPRLAR